MTKSPTIRLLFGLLITLAAVTGFSWHALYQISGLRKLQADTIDLSRHDSFLLLRVQNDLNMIGLKLRDMTQAPRGPGIAQYGGQFARLREDLEDALQSDAQLIPVGHRAKEQADLVQLLNQFWQTSDQVFTEAAAGNEAAARALVSTELSAQQSMLAGQVSFSSTSRTGSEVDFDSRRGVAFRFPRAARRVWTDTYGSRRDAL